MTSTDEHGATPRPPDRSTAVALSAWKRNVPEHLHEWYDSLPTRSDLSDTHKIIDQLGYKVGWAEHRPTPETTTHRVRDHRTGTCFDNESSEMRQECVGSIGVMLDASDDVLHEVRHQMNGYHTDLVYADIDPEGLRKRDLMTVGQDPIHDPLQRFRVWWDLVEFGPKPRSEAIENGRYSDPRKNQKHLEWLLDHGYIGRTAADHVDAVVPPSIATLHAVELKLRDWKTALEQADRSNRFDGPDYYSPVQRDRYGYADYRWVALDAGAIRPAMEHRDEFEELDVGLLAVAEGGAVQKMIDASREPRGRYTRDRAYAESQIWERANLEEHLKEPAADIDTEPDVQPSLAAFDGGMK